METYETSNIEVAAYLAATGFPYNVTPGPDQRALFSFGDTSELRLAIINFERGGFAKRLLGTRSRLFREASSAMREAPPPRPRALPPHVVAELERCASESSQAPFVSREVSQIMPELISEVLRIDREVQR